MEKTTGHDLPTSRYVESGHRRDLRGVKRLEKAKLINPQISPEEMKVLLDGFADPNPLYGSGFHIDGVKYTVIAATDKTIRGKQVSPPPRK
jgi:hypothetical protein